MRSFRILLGINLLILLLFLLTGFESWAQSDMNQLRLAQSLEKAHEYESALKIYEKLENNNRFKKAVEKGIRSCLSGLRHFDQLVKYLEKLVIQYNSNNKYLVLLAFETWVSVINKNGNDISVYRLVAGSMINNRLIDEAIEVYEQALKKIKNQNVLHLDLANLYKSMLNMEKAAYHFLEYYGKNARQKVFLQRQILGLAKSEQHLSSVTDALNIYIEQHPQKLFVKEILGGLFIKSKQFDKAFEIYNSLEKNKLNGEYLFQFAIEAQKNHAFNFAIKAFKNILENKKLPIYGLAYFQLAKTYYLKAKENDEVSASLNKAIPVFKNLVSKNDMHSFSDESAILLGDIYFEFYFDLDKAIQYYNLVYEKYPKSKRLSEALIKLGDSYLMKGNVKKARESYLKNQDQEYASVINFKLAELDYYFGEFDKALEKYNVIINNYGIKDSLTNNTLERSLLINSFLKDSIDLKKFSYGELLIFQQKYSEGIKHLNELLVMKNGISSTAGRIMADVLLKLEKYEDANNLLKDLIKEYPDDYYTDEFLFKNAKVEEILGNYIKSFELYQTLLDKFTNSLYYEKAREKARILNERIKKDAISG